MRYIQSDGVDLVSLCRGEIGLLFDLLLLWGAAIVGYSMLLLLFETTVENGAKNDQEYDANGSKDDEPNDQNIDVMDRGSEVIIFELHYAENEQGEIGQKEKNFNAIHSKQDPSQQNVMAMEKY